MVCPARSPAVTLISTSNSASGWYATAAVARAAGLDGIEVDVNPWLLPCRGDRIVANDEVPALNANAVWLPRVSDGFLLRRRQDTALIAARAALSRAGAERIVVSRPLPHQLRPGSARSNSDMAFFTRTCTGLSDVNRVTLGLRADQLGGGREHLVELTLLRRYAEEWDFDIALDLSGEIDPTWEAEAAIWRLMPRLQIIRLGPLSGRAQRSTAPRLASRVLSGAADLGYRGTIALSPDMSRYLRRLNSKSIEAATMTAELIRWRFHPDEPRDRRTIEHLRRFSV